jgi:hypothetical protein
MGAAGARRPGRVAGLVEDDCVAILGIDTPADQILYQCLCLLQTGVLDDVQPRCSRVLLKRRVTSAAPQSALRFLIW